MKYTMRLNGRLMTNINVSISLTHEQVYQLQAEANERKLTLKQLIRIKCVNTDTIDGGNEESEEE